MKCPICEQNMKKFKFDNPKELLFQCKECNFNVNIQKNKMIISLNDRLNISEFTNYQSDRTWKFYYSEEKYDRKKELKQWKDIECIINSYRKKNKKKKIRYYHPMKKKCSCCKKIKNIKKFNYKTSLKRQYLCKKCNSIKYKNYYFTINSAMRNRYKVIKIYQKKLFNKNIDYSFNEFCKWLNKTNFNNMYNNYLNCNKHPKLRVCVVRKNTNIDFSLDNLIVMTKTETAQKNSIFVRREYDQRVPVVQIKNNKIIEIFPSIKDTESKGFQRPNVNTCCQGKRKSHAGYQWKYFKDL